MRAFSSLIGHILGSHPDINGYYEMHISYQNNNNLLEQENLYQQQESIKPGSYYLFDKLLHNDYELDLSSLNLTKPKILITLRSPEQTIKSIINLFQKKEVRALYSEPEHATKYYIQRLEELSKFCVSNTKTYYYFDAELIQSSTQDMLKILTQWLQLNSPLADQYRLFSQTGKTGTGDSSSIIQSGKIIKTGSNYSDIGLAEDLLKLAEKGYAKYRELMINHAIEQRIKH